MRCRFEGEAAKQRTSSGDALLHTDIRSDNVLLTPDGGTVFLDWGWTCNGAPWLDLLLFALWVNTEGGADAEPLVRGHPLTREVPPGSIDAIMLAAAGNYWWLSLRSASPGARDHQRRHALAIVRWLRRRIPD